MTDDGRAPICPFCGVTALPADPSHVIDVGFVCENPDCEAFGGDRLFLAGHGPVQVGTDLDSTPARRVTGAATFRWRRAP